jgi:hypothetical protein
VRQALDAPGPNARNIRRALDAEYGRWRIFSNERLRQFGSACDRF